MRLTFLVLFLGLAFGLTADYIPADQNARSRDAVDTEQGILLSGLLNELGVVDFKSKVQIQAKNLTVRSALSDYIPLKGRSHKILWIARTKLGAQETSYIQFRLSNDSKP